VGGRGALTGSSGQKWRLHKWLAACGVASRRRAEDLVRQGRVSVNGVRVTRPGALCDPSSDIVEVDGRPVAPPQRRLYLALNKPPGYVSSLRDAHAEKLVVDLLPRDMALRVKPAGRLDKDSEGLMLLTDDGPLIHRLIHPRYEVEKEYRVGVAGEADERLAAALVEGVELEEGWAEAVEADVLRRGAGVSVLRVVLVQGRKRQIRRMLAALGRRVVFLRRVRIGPIRLGRLAQGKWRRLTRAEVRLLYETVGLGGGESPGIHPRPAP